MKYGIDAILKVINFPLELVAVIQQVRAADSPGGKNITVLEYGKFLSLIDDLIQFLASLGKVPSQFRDLDPEEQQLVSDHIARSLEELNLGPEYIRAIAVRIFDVINFEALFDVIDLFGGKAEALTKLRERLNNG